MIHAPFTLLYVIGVNKCKLFYQSFASEVSILESLKMTLMDCLFGFHDLWIYISIGFQIEGMLSYLVIKTYLLFYHEILLSY